MLVACGVSRLPAPSYAQNVSSAYDEVPYPPPPARVEFVPKPPQKGAVWLDGEWTWEGTRYAWKRGRWVLPPANARFAPWTATRDATGVYFIAEGTWRDPNGKEVAEPEPLAYGSPNGGKVTTPEGATAPPAPVVHGQQSNDKDAAIISDAAPDTVLPHNDATPDEADGGAP